MILTLSPAAKPISRCYRYNVDGSLDTTFGGGTGYFTESIANTDRATMWPSKRTGKS